MGLSRGILTHNKTAEQTASLKQRSKGNQDRCTFVSVQKEWEDFLNFSPRAATQVVPVILFDLLGEFCVVIGTNYCFESYLL